MNASSKPINWDLFKIGMIRSYKAGLLRDAEEARLKVRLDEIARERKERATILGGATVPQLSESPPLGWLDLEVEVIAISELRFRRRDARKWSRPVPMEALALNDKRIRPDKPSQLWELLMRLALAEGALNWENEGSKHGSKSLPKQIERLGKKLGSFFGIKGSPFAPYDRRNGEYRARFRITMSDNLRRHIDTLAAQRSNDDEPMFTSEYRHDNSRESD